MDKRIKIVELQRIRKVLYTHLKRATTRYEKQGLAPKKDAQIDSINNKIDIVENKLLGLGVDLYGNSVIPLF